MRTTDEGTLKCDNPQHRPLRHTPETTPGHDPEDMGTQTVACGLLEADTPTRAGPLASL